MSLKLYSSAELSCVQVILEKAVERVLVKMTRGKHLQLLVGRKQHGVAILYQRVACQEAIKQLAEGTTRRVLQNLLLQLLILVSRELKSANVINLFVRACFSRVRSL